MATLHTAGEKMYNQIFKYRLLILAAVFLFLPLSFVGAVNYGLGTYNSGFYSSTQPGNPVASPVASAYNTTQQVSITAASSTSIQYAIDVMPADCSSGTTYTVAISVATSTTIYARACNSYGNSATSTFAYLIDTEEPSIPTATPLAGLYNSAQSVSLSAVGSDYMRYSTSSIPTDCSSGTLYGGAISVPSSQTIYTRACDLAGNSSTTNFTYTIDTVPPSTPTATPSASLYNSTQLVTLAASGSDSIRYSISGTPATCSSDLLYTSAISVSSSKTIYTRACDLAENSSTANFSYTIDTVPPSTPTATPAAGIFNSVQSVTLDSTGSDYIKYSISQTPASCSSGTSYAGPIDVLSSQTIYVRACDNAGNSSTGTFAYTIDTSVPLTPAATPASGPYNTTQSVSLSASGSNTIRYSSSATPATCSSGSLYNSAIPVSSSQTIYVRACSLGGNSSTGSFSYIIDTVPPETPTASPSAGSYNTAKSITLDAVGSTYLKYSTSQMPASCSSGTTYAGVIPVSSSQTIYVRACDDADNSSTSNFAYTIDSVAPTITSISSDTTPTISWTTNKLASSIIDYGLTSSYGVSTSETNISPRVTSHSVTILSLSQCATYHYHIRSRDAATNEGVSSDQTFTTGGCTASSVQTENTSGQIDRTIGGTLTTSDGALSIGIPINFAASNANFQIHQLDKTTVIAQTSVPSGYLSAGSELYELKALSDNTSVISTFTNPLTITMSYTASDIVGLDEASLKIYRWDNSAWNQLTNCSVNTSDKIVTCNTSNFSVFGIFGQAASASNGGSMPSSWNNKPIAPTGGFKITVSGNTLSFNAGSDVKKMAISLDSNFNNASLENYTATKEINLCSSSCTVYVKFYTGYGVASDVVSQEIIIKPVDLPIIIAPVLPTEPTKSEIVFKELKLGSQDPRVKVLQQFLNQNGYMIADNGAGSLGHETDYFGSLTVSALTKFQVANKLTSEKGYLGKITQAFIDSFIKSKVAKSISGSQLSGRILLQVESHGEAWYVNPKDNKRYYLGRPDDAFNLMRILSLGISEKEFASWSSSAPTWAKGRLYIRPQSHGEAYYVDLNRQPHYLGRPLDAWLLLKSQGLGITNSDLNKIVIASGA